MVDPSEYPKSRLRQVVAPDSAAPAVLDEPEGVTLRVGSILPSWPKAEAGRLKPSLRDGGRLDPIDRQASAGSTPARSTPRSAITVAVAVGSLLLGLVVVSASHSLVMAAPPEAGTVVGSDALKAIDSGIGELVNRLKSLQARVSQPRPEPQPADPSELGVRLNNLARSTAAVAPLANQVERLENQVEAAEKELAKLQREVAALKAKLGKKAGPR